jgi:hypothetical protein
MNDSTNKSPTGPADGPCSGREVSPLRKMRQISDNKYVAEGGWQMQREQGLTPNGNRIGGFWVLRGPDAQWVDYDQYRHDLLARHGFDAPV